MSYPWPNYAASDLYIRSHDATNGQYYGVCNEYATMFTSFDRALGVPTQRFAITMQNSTGYTVGHTITQIWDGSNWINTDPTWNSFNNPQVYKQAGYHNIALTRLNGADDEKSPNNPLGDEGLLNAWTDFDTIQYLGQVSAYN